MTKSKKKQSAEVQTMEKKPLAAPTYTRENLSKRTIAELMLIQERHEVAGLNEIALICLELIEEKRLLEIASKPIRTKKAIGDGSKETKIKRPRVRRANSSAITWHFEDIGAPLHNTVWSWGAMSDHRKEIILRVWSDEIIFDNEDRLIQLTLHSRFKGSNNPGYRERLGHIELIKNGAKAFAIICYPVDKESIPRKIKSYDRDHLYPIYKIVERGGDDWGVLGEGIKVSNFLAE